METPLIWAEIDLNAIAHNVRELRRITDPKARLMAVVKANAYGHGAVKVALRALDSGADILGVARAGEAIQLRQAGLQVPILVFGYTPPAMAQEVIDYDLTLTVYALETAQAYDGVAASGGKKIKVHVKVDSGMGRLGLLLTSGREMTPATDALADAVREVSAIARLRHLELEGVFTHFASSDSRDKSYANQQFAVFTDFLDRLGRAGIQVPIRHAANSGAVIDMPETHLDMVRPGIALYGLAPSNEVETRRVSLAPAMAVKARIIHLKQVPAGFKVSYGSTYETEGSTTIATVPVGYADGFNRLMSSRGHMLVCGSRVPVVGRICMDLCMLDVGHIPGVGLETEVTVFGRQGDAHISVDEIAARLNTINYEIVTAISGRVPRVYLG